MQADKYKKYTALDFLKDRDFLKWQLFSNREDMLFRDCVTEEFPELATVIEEAVALFKKNIRFNDYTMTRSEISDRLVLLQNLIDKKRKQNISRFIVSISAIAVSICIILFLSRIFNKNENIPDILTFVQDLPDTNDFNSSDTKLIVSENNTIILHNTESSIKYEENAIEADGNLIHKEESSLYNQLIIPYGKRTVITFSDGTKAWVNAGSRLVYPAEFNKRKREIYLDGEIYFEVCEDKKSPFVIKTRQMDISVLGTKFNVSAYETDTIKSVVLLSGSVSIFSELYDKEIILTPNQMYSDSENSYSVKNVDANIYILWAQGLYQFDSERLGAIIARLVRYYGTKIECDSASAELKCSGKLNLKDDLNRLLTELSRALPIKYRYNIDGSYTINAKS